MDHGQESSASRLTRLIRGSDKARRIGYLDDPYIFPCVGNDADGPNPYGELAFPLEGSCDSRNNGVALVQQRSPVVKVVELGVIGEFAKKNLGDFALATGMKHVVVLSSLDFMRLQKIDASRYSYL
ncbi:hypothetical protein Peur_036063 [Populus x canadensis]